MNLESQQVSKVIIKNFLLFFFVLSILGNLVLHDEARKQMKPHLKIIVSILTSIDEEAILGRTCRVLANVAQDMENSRILKNLGLLMMLVKTLNEFLKTPKAKSAAVRAIRIVGSVEKKENLLSSNAIASVSSLLTSEDEDLLKVIICLHYFVYIICLHYFVYII